MSGNPHRLSEKEKQAVHAAAQLVVSVHHGLAKWMRPGMTLAEIDKWIAKTLDERGARSCFLNYKTGGHPPFPAHACLGLNDCIVHGTPMAYTAPIKLGDLVKIDIGVFYEGWVGDAGWSYMFGEPTPLIRKLTSCGKEALRRGVEALHPNNRWRAFAEAVQGHVETECGFHVVQNLGGHGYGRTLHGKPFVANAMPRPGESPWPEANELCRPGTLVAVEPMIGVGTGRTRQMLNKFNPKVMDWPIYTADGTLSVHYEHDVMITEEGPWVLTKGMEDIPDVIG